MPAAFQHGLAALALVIAGPHRERFEVIHAPRVVLFLLLGASLLISGAVPRLAWRWLEWTGVAALVACLVGAAVSLSPAYALLPFASACAAFAVWLGTSGQSASARVTWLRWMGAAVTVVAVLGLLELFGLGLQSLPGRAPSATMGQRNALAHFLVLGSPVVWWLSLRASSRAERLLWLSTVAVVAIVVVQTRSRAAWLVAPLVVLSFSLLARQRRVVTIVLTLVASVVISLSLPTPLRWGQPRPFLDTASRLFDTRTGSGAGRIAEWRDSLSLVERSPLLGRGAGSWFVEYGVPHQAGRFAHSDWVGIIFERGAIGLVLWLALGLAQLWRWRRREDLSVVATTLLAAAALGLFDSVLQLPAPLLWVTLTLAVAQRPDAPRAPAPWGGACLALLAGVFALVFASRVLSTSDFTPFDRLELAAKLDPLDGVLRVTLAEAWVSAGHCDRARPHLAAAERLLPLHPALGNLRAACP